MTNTIQRRANYEPSVPQEQFIVPLLRHHIERALATYATPAPAQSRALDVGCGRQPFREALELAGYSYVGLDIEQNPEGTVDVVCFIDQPYPEALSRQAPFQFILCTEVLEHVADWAKAFQNLSELTAPGGRILITCPHFYQLHEEPHDYWRPTLHALNYHAERAGFRVLEQQAIGNAWDVLGTALANCWPTAVGGGLLNRLLTKTVRTGKNCLFNLIKRRRLQSRVQLNGSLYMSNIIILERV